LLEQVKKISNSKYDSYLIVEKFVSEFPVINELLDTDIEAIYSGDPACENQYEIILCYPGFNAIFTYRFAHVLYKLGIPILPRLLTEHAHSRTGIDIHPGASIDSHFFIDHGTGIVIGETTVIGKNVKIYQGVTLGALSLRGGQSLKGVKRHPTVGDNVTIYSGASIFGGNTIIGDNSTIGSNAFITESIEANSLYTINGVKTKVNK
jgi:serine O-acetyltransferase